MGTKNQISRRDFLRLTAFTAAGMCLAACQPSLGTLTPQNYYQLKKEDILKTANEMAVFIQSQLASAYDQALADTVLAESQQRFEKLLPDLPYIGGDQNDLTENLFMTAYAMTFYQSMKSHGKTLEETGKILYLATEQQISSSPMMGIIGRVTNSSLMHEKIKAEAEISHKQQYPGDWIFDFVEGDGATFDWGIDYLECGICKYLKVQGASELAPYMCILDFPISKAMNTGLARTSTLAHGASKCDFRYKTGRPIQMEWTPDFLK